MNQRNVWIDKAGSRRFRRYPEYKNSGIEWLGKIPVHWEVQRLKYLATLNDEVLPESTDPSFEMSYVDISSVDAFAGITATEGMAFEKAPSRARRIVHRGDVIVSTVRTYLRAITAIQAPEPNLIVSTGFAVIRPRQLESSFASYTLRAPHFVERVVANSVGVSYPAINTSSLACFPIAYPDVHEQRFIAAFLDRETAKIDALVARKERLIELLQEKRSAFISRTVTRGLDSNVPVKDSGVEWLGEIPAHWVTWKATHGFRRIGSGTTPKSNNPEYYDGDIAWVTTSELRESVIVDTTKKVTAAAVRENPTLRMYPKGTLLFAMYGATIGRLGILGIAATVNQACAALAEPVHFITRFVYYWLQMRRPTLIVLSAGGGQPNLSQDDLRQLRIPAPPLDEQRAVADVLDHETARIDALIAKVHEAIDHLNEFRTALISAAVTGKIDVREDAF